ncbi:MAG: hypothetical protein R3B94_09375 [Hyphomonas sp.]
MRRTQAELRDVLDTLGELFVHHGPPEHIRSDNSPRAAPCASIKAHQP